MPEQQYSNRELDQLFNSQRELIKTEFGALHSRMDNFESDTSADLSELKKDTGSSLNRIEEQTTKTNGRVNKLEEAEVDNRIFRARVYTALSILTFVISMILVPLVAAYIGSA